MRVLPLALLVVASVIASSGCPRTVGSDGDEGEEGEGEGGGEGEGEPGEGEGEPGEGEGESGEGEGEPGEGEGEGEPGGAGATCERDRDCGGGTVCLFADPDNDGFILDGRCGTPGSGQPPGSTCAGGSSCDRGVCTDQLCSVLCEQNSDCPTGMACTTTSFSVDGGGGGVAAICTPDATLPPTACVDDQVCLASGRLCNDLVGSNTFTLQCGFPGSGAALGGACASPSLETRTACQTGLCDGDTAGMCTRACTSNDQCGPGLICSGSPFNNISGDFCADPCLNNTQCPADRRCQLRDNRAGTAFDFVCAEPPGTLATGTTTTNGLQCESGFTINGRCSEICGGGHTCPSAMPFCATVTFTNPTTNVPACSNVNPNP